MKCFIVDYTFEGGPVYTKLFGYDRDQIECEKFCADIKKEGGLVNIRIRDVQIPN